MAYRPCASTSVCSGCPVHPEAFEKNFLLLYFHVEFIIFFTFKLVIVTPISTIIYNYNNTLFILAVMHFLNFLF